MTQDDIPPHRWRFRYMAQPVVLISEGLRETTLSAHTKGLTGSAAEHIETLRIKLSLPRTAAEVEALHIDLEENLNRVIQYVEKLLVKLVEVAFWPTRWICLISPHWSLPSWLLS